MQTLHSAQERSTDGSCHAFCLLLFAADAHEHTDDCTEDDLAELRELLGVAEDPALDDGGDSDDCPDTQSGPELQRLLQNLHSAVTPGSPYTVLQVSLHMHSTGWTASAQHSPLWQR